MNFSCQTAYAAPISRGSLSFFMLAAVLCALTIVESIIAVLRFPTFAANNLNASRNLPFLLQRLNLLRIVLCFPYVMGISLHERPYLIIQIAQLKTTIAGIFSALPGAGKTFLNLLNCLLDSKGIFISYDLMGRLKGWTENTLFYLISINFNTFSRKSDVPRAYDCFRCIMGILG